MSRALRTLPTDIRNAMENVAVIVEDEPSAEDLAEVGMRPGDSLLGLYRGIPLTDRTSSYGMVLPDRILIYRKPIERMCGSDQEITQQIRQTVVHEIAHHFGLSDSDLRRLRR